MGKMIDISGGVYGRWKVIEFSGMNKSGGSTWLCECECGVRRCVDGRSLRSGASKSCGCLGAEHRIAAAVAAVTKHHGKSERLYNVWSGMKDRCNNPKNKFYDRYGGRGITICDEWASDYTAFRDWAFANGYDPTLQKGKCTLDRLDNNKGYCPENCAWRTSKQQCNNRSNNHVIEYNGIKHTLSEWAEITGLRKDTLRRRIEVYGWDLTKAITTPNLHTYTA